MPLLAKLDLCGFIDIFPSDHSEWNWYSSYFCITLPQYLSKPYLPSLFIHCSSSKRASVLPSISICLHFRLTLNGLKSLRLGPQLGKTNTSILAGNHPLTYCRDHLLRVFMYQAHCQTQCHTLYIALSANSCNHIFRQLLLCYYGYYLIFYFNIYLCIVWGL